MDSRYDHALAAALTVAGELDGEPGMSKHRLISLLVFAILHAMESFDEERGSIYEIEGSAN